MHLSAHDQGGSRECHHPGSVRQVDAVLYEAVKRACLAVLSAAPDGLTPDEIRERLGTHIGEEAFSGGAGMGWWVKTVQLDLEAKGVIERGKTRPLRLRKVEPSENIMLNNKQPVATVAVSDLQAARRFYEDKVGFPPPADPDPQMVTYRCGNGSLFVYRSDHAGTNKATAVTWMVGDDLADVVRKLGSKGVAFESYDIPDAVKEGDVYVFGEIRTAWFKDPDGNIHALING